MNNFNPASYVHTAQDTWELKLKYDEFIKENSHLASPFHVTGLEDIVPKRYPGDLTVHFAKSHEGKSTAIRQSVFKSQMAVEDTDYMVALCSLEDNAETSAAKFVRLYGNESMKYRDDQLIFIGRRFNMKPREMSSLNVDNIRRSLEWALDKYDTKKGFSHIYVDYVQIVPQSENAISRERRDQAFYATQQLFEMSSQFKCPIDFASQALLKGSHSHYSGKMRIPGAADLKEAGELYEIPGIAIAYWMPKRQPDTPIGTIIEDGAWRFKVEANLIFVKIEKWRNCELQDDKNGNPFDVVGRIFPCWIQPNGEIVYSVEKHKHMLMMSISEKETLT